MWKWTDAKHASPRNRSWRWAILATTASQRGHRHHKVWTSVECGRTFLSAQLNVSVSSSSWCLLLSSSLSDWFRSPCPLFTLRQVNTAIKEFQCSTQSPCESTLRQQIIHRRLFTWWQLCALIDTFDLAIVEWLRERSQSTLYAVFKFIVRPKWITNWPLIHVETSSDRDIVDDPWWDKETAMDWHAHKRPP